MIIWDYRDQLKEVELDKNKNKAYYVYDSSGERVRKIVEKQGGIIEERKYLGGYEVFTKTVSGTVETERTSLFISDGNKTIAQIDDDSHIKTVRYQYDNLPIPIGMGSASLELDQDGGFIRSLSDSYEEY